MPQLSQASSRALSRLRAYRTPSSIYHSLPLTRRAAVLVLLFADRHGDLRVILTLRSNHLNSYAGQVSLPGGKADDLQESPFQTARREADEEISLPASNALLPPRFQVEHLCELPAHLATAGIAVRPCVAFLSSSESVPGASSEEKSEGGDGDARKEDNGDDKSPPLTTSPDADAEETLFSRLNPKEVAVIFSAPFQRFSSSLAADGGPSPIKYRGSWMEWVKGPWRMHNFYVPHAEAGARFKTDSAAREDYDSDDEDVFKVWGLTARVLVDAARIAFGKDPDFEHCQTNGEEDLIRKLFDEGQFTKERQPGEGTVVRKGSRLS